METVQYLCEFFFGNFWHFLGLWFLLSSIGGFKGSGNVYINKDNEDGKDGNDKH